VSWNDCAATEVQQPHDN